MVAAGEIGRLRLIQASFGFTLTQPGDIRLDAALGGGALLDVGSYPVSLVRALAGARPVRVQAVATTMGEGVNGTTMATLEHADGLLAQIGASFGMALHRTALVVGEMGYVETNYANHIAPERPAWLRVKRGQTGNALPEPVELALANGFRLEAESFADAIREGAERWTGATPAESVDVALTLDAIARSARTGEAVEL
jgi:predicted dehydrogenase